jgi:hypothetical protein
VQQRLGDQIGELGGLLGRNDLQQELARGGDEVEVLVDFGRQRLGARRDPPMARSDLLRLGRGDLDAPVAQRADPEDRIGVGCQAPRLPPRIGPHRKYV